MANPRAVATTETQPFGNSSVVSPLPGVAIGCMKREAREILDLSEERYRRFRIRSGKRASTPAFIRWLFRRSRLVEGVDEKKAQVEYVKHMQEIRERLKDHPDPAFRKRVGQGSIHSFAYWFFRWSGLVQVVAAHESIDER